MCGGLCYSARRIRKYEAQLQMGIMLKGYLSRWRQEKKPESDVTDYKWRSVLPLR
jgi:hypothetical protein